MSSYYGWNPRDLILTGVPFYCYNVALVAFDDFQLLIGANPFVAIS